MKKQICSLALSTIFGLGVALAAPQSQDQPAPPASPADGANGVRGHHQFNPDRQLHMLSKRLNLTDDQQKQILPILANRRQQMESLRADSTLAPQDRRAKLRSLRDESDLQIKAVLNDSQKQTYEQMQQQMHDREQQRREQRQGSGGPAGTL